jgi:hypothetical protein
MTPPRSANTKYLRVPVGLPQKYARPIFTKTKVDSEKSKIRVSWREYSFLYNFIN